MPLQFDWQTSGLRQYDLQRLGLREVDIVNLLLKHIVNVIGCDSDDADRIVMPGLNLRYVNDDGATTLTCVADR